MPICIGLPVASQLSSRWDSITALRIAKNRWAVTSNDQPLKENFEIAPRNVNRARIRLTVERYRGQMGAENDARYPTGNIINDPAGDVLPPPVSE